MKTQGKIFKTAALQLVLATALIGFDPAVTAAAENAKVTTGGWLIHRPSKEYRDLPALLPKQQESGPRPGSACSNSFA